MKLAVPTILDKARITEGDYASTPSMGLTGAFAIDGPEDAMLRVIASDGSDWEGFGLPLPAWEHVSVSLGNRCPNWPEMCFVKGLFWPAAETVLQYHPAEGNYVNHHPFCLHLWRPIGVDVPLPPVETVGPR